MTRTRTTLVILLTLLVAGAAAIRPAYQYYQRRNRPQWKNIKVSRGIIIEERSATGKVQPVLSVVIGSFVSGPIEKIYVDFNEQVKQGELLAKIDPRLFEANVARDSAALKARAAEILQIEALLGQARNDERRVKMVQAEDAAYIAQSEIDQYVFRVKQLEAQLEAAHAATAQAQAALDNSTNNLDYTNIRAPIDGVVLHRQIDPGQTLASTFQTPELFKIAPDLRAKVHVFASVDEADIGRIRQAKEANRPVHFTVDSWPGDLFEGEIEQIRVSSTETQNVVTYPVVVAASNPELKLLPGMTASLSFVVDRVDDALRIPNEALRFLPDRKHVRAEDRAILDGDDSDEVDEGEDGTPLTSAERTAERQQDRHRHVWIEDGDELRAVRIVVGLSDSRLTEVVSGDLVEGQAVVVGQKSKARDKNESDAK